METSLKSLSKIFTENLYRIPDYQRGYAWTEKHLKDFWNDLVQLEEEKNHYIGVLTVEEVSKEQYEKWEDDVWIIDSKSYKPLYIVDGQQRLTTSIILIQAITEFIPESGNLNYNTKEEIRKKYIFESKDEGISRSYIFGYEKDNPSYDYLKSKVFNEQLTEFSSEPETIYTNNLEKAKAFFKQRLSEIKFEEIETIFKKLTQNFLFNSYAISSDIDVFIAFETMNNRGKPLSYLELLKNRLIYLSTKFKVSDSEKNKLRKSVNECWKSIYHNLGRNKDLPLDDDDFLRNHFLIYFGKKIYEGFKKEFKEEISYQMFLRSRRRRGNLDYPVFLLEEHFVTKNIKCETNEDGIGITDVYDYVNSLQNSVETWYKIFNPKLGVYFTEEESYWLDKLNRRSFNPVASLIMVFFANEKSEKKRIKLLTSLERYLFITSVLSYRYHYAVLNSAYIELATDLSENLITSDKVLTTISENNNKLYNDSENKKAIIKTFKSYGFYKWDGIYYFLYEYDLSLYERSKTKRIKIDWTSFSSLDYKTVEHIYPQTARKSCWTKNYSKYSTKQRNVLRHSLGNLVPLSQSKNSSFQNKCFIDKISNDANTVGFRFGSYSENEITKYTEWTPIQILERGIMLLNFMEKRWNLQIGGVKEKIEFLNLGFILEKESIKIEEITTGNTVYKK
jgi:predicted nucleic acid-binding protein